MAATLNVQFADAPPSDPAPLRNVVLQAFQEWTRHFDYAAGTYTINVSFRASIQPADVSLSYGYQDNGVVVRPRANANIYGDALGFGLTGRGAGPTGAGTLYVNPAYLDGSRPVANALAPTERELGHQLGIQSLKSNVAYRGGAAVEINNPNTLYDAGVVFVTTLPPFVTTFNGPNAQAACGGPVPVVNYDPSTTTVGGGRAVTTNTQGAGTLQPLDIALLRDAGVAALTDQELGEHQVARLYVAAFGRNADSAELIQHYAGLRAGLSRADLLASFSDSQEHINLIAQRTSARDAAGLSLDLSPHLGIIPVISGPVTAA